MSPKKDFPEITKLISFGVDAEFARTLPKKARQQILEGITGLKKD